LTIGMELTLDGSLEPTRANPSPSKNPHTKNTAVFVDRKNYRLQDIQLKKNNRRTSNFTRELRTCLLRQPRPPQTHQALAPVQAASCSFRTSKVALRSSAASAAAN